MSSLGYSAEGEVVYFFKKIIVLNSISLAREDDAYLLLLLHFFLPFDSVIFINSVLVSSHSALTQEKFSSDSCMQNSQMIFLYS